MNYTIYNWKTGAAIYEAEINCPEDAPESLKKGLAAQAAIQHGVKLCFADLSGADLSRAYLHGADLTEADLTVADLREAAMTNADLCGAYLHGAKIGTKRY